MFLFSFLFGLSFYLLLPSEKSVVEVAMQFIPPKTTVTEVKLKSPNSPAIEKKVNNLTSNIAIDKPNNPQNQPTSPSRSAMGNASRIAQMIARISNQNPLSKNLVIVKNAVVDKNQVSNQLMAAQFDQSGGNKNGLGRIGSDLGTTKIGTLHNNHQSGSHRAIASLSAQTANSAGQAGLSVLDEEVEVEGGLDPEIIANIIRKHLGEILYCYERQLTIHPDLFGKLSIKFIIGATGNVENTRIIQNSLKNNIVENCVTQRISQWKFPAPKGGTQVIVSYPFLFKNTY